MGTERRVVRRLCEKVDMVEVILGVVVDTVVGTVVEGVVGLVLLLHQETGGEASEWVGTKAPTDEAVATGEEEEVGDLTRVKVRVEGFLEDVLSDGARAFSRWIGGVLEVA